MKSTKYLFFTLIFQLLSCATSRISTDKDANKTEFDKVNTTSNWQLELSDPCTGNWQDNWFMEGKFGFEWAGYPPSV
jgi:hypothetical protein